MTENTFRMILPRSGFLRYVLLSFLPSVSYVLIVSILVFSGIIHQEYLPGYFGGAVWIYIFAFPCLVVPRSHNIEVRGDTLIESDHKGLHIRTVHADQVDHFRVNLLKEIVLFDSNNHKLLCVEHDMTYRDQFEEWLLSHRIKLCKGSGMDDKC